MDMNQAFPSKYIKAADLQGKEVAVTISHVGIENVGTEEKPSSKPVIYFKGTEKGLVLNVTNNNTVMGIHGTESDMWCDKQITLFAMQVEFQGKMTWGVRVKLPVMAALGAAPIGAAPPFGGLPPTTEQAQDITNTEGGGGVINDEIPF